MSLLNSFSQKDLEDFIKTWNIKYPLDRWWRKKYNIPFGSDKHLKQDIFSIKLEYEEDILFNQELEQYKKKKEEEEDSKYIPGSGIIFKKVKDIEMTDDEIDEIFDDIDLDNLNLDIDGDGIIEI